MIDPRHAKRNQPDGPQSFFSLYVHVGGLAPLVVLLMVVGAEAGGYFYGKIASQLNREGIITDATVIDIEQFEETTRNANSTLKSTSVWTIVDYEFQTEAGETIKDEKKSKDLAKIPAIGSTFTVRYAESDPSVHEARVGHYQSNTDAMHWIAAAFVGVALLCVVAYLFEAIKIWRSPQQPRMPHEVNLAE